MFDRDSFVAAIVSCDAERWSQFFAADAVWLEYRHDRPPAAPNVMRGRRQIRLFLRTVCQANVRFDVEDLVATGNSVWFRLILTVPGGRRAIEHVHLRVADHVIVQQTEVESWDG